MARKAPNQPITDVQVNTEELAQARTTLTQAVQIESQIEKQLAEAYAFGKTVGSSQAFDFLATVATEAAVIQFEKVKKSKTWSVLRNPKSRDISPFQSLDEFCEVTFGKSYRRMQEISANMRTLGQESFSQAEKLGLRQIDYNAIKALPAPDQELVRRALEESTTREEAIDIVQELASRHGVLTKRAEELDSQIKDKDRLILDKNAKIDDLDSQLTRKFQPSQDSIAQSLQEAAQLNELNDAVNGVDALFTKLGVVVANLMESSARESIRERAVQSVQYLVSRMREIVLENQIEVDVESEALGGRPDWLNDIN